MQLFRFIPTCLLNRLFFLNRSFVELRYPRRLRLFEAFELGFEDINILPNHLQVKTRLSRYPRKIFRGINNHVIRPQQLLSTPIVTI